MGGREEEEEWFLSAGSLELGHGGVDLLAVLVVANTGRGQTVATTLTRTDTDNVSVDGARDTVDHLDVELGQGVLLVDGGLAQVTDGSSLNNVAHSESLDGLVLGHGARAVGASHESNVASAGLVAAIRVDRKQVKKEANVSVVGRREGGAH